MKHASQISNQEDRKSKQDNKIFGTNCLEFLKQSDGTERVAGLFEQQFLKPDDGEAITRTIRETAWDNSNSIYNSFSFYKAFSIGKPT